MAKTKTSARKRPYEYDHEYGLSVGKTKASSKKAKSVKKTAKKR
jgi:hypothetical protein